MRSNDEFIENIYKKRDAAVKKRNRKIAAAASGLCVAVIAFVGATEVVPLLRHKSTAPVEEKPDIVDVSENVTAVADAEGTYLYDSAFDESPESGFVPEEEIYHLTDVYTRPAFGYDGDDKIQPEIQTEIAEEGENAENVNGAVTSSSTRASYTDEQIVDAAYSSLSAEEKSRVVSKSSHMSMVSYEVNVGEFYEVWFDATDGGYVKVKLDSSNLERVK